MILVGARPGGSSAPYSILGLAENIDTVTELIYQRQAWEDTQADNDRVVNSEFVWVDLSDGETTTAAAQAKGGG